MTMTVRFTSAHAVTGELTALGMSKDEARQTADHAWAARTAFPGGVPTPHGHVRHVSESHWEITYASIPVIPREEQPRRSRATAVGPGSGTRTVTWTPGQAAAALQSRTVPEGEAWHALADALQDPGPEPVTAGGVTIRRAGPSAYALTLE